MAGYAFSFIVIAALLGVVLMGIHIVTALGLVSILGVSYLMGGIDRALRLMSNTTYEAIRDYIFAVVPLFVLMGELVARSGAATDLYNIVNRGLGRLPGRLAVATVGGNAVFGAVTGVSIASAATFSRIAYPQMMAHNYDRKVALGSIAGSAALGMLIPPSVLMIVWGVITEDSIGRLFIAGVVPGILLSLMYGVFLSTYAVMRPEKFGGRADELDTPPPLTRSEGLGALGISLLIILVLGGIWFGVFTPTEAAGIGALLALVLGLAKGMTLREVATAVWATGRTSAPILFLLIMAQFYSRLLALGGVVDSVQETVMGMGASPVLILIFMFVVWFILGMFIDSVSIILLTVPIFHPIAVALGFDPIAFAIIGIVVIEAGLVTPPFGISVYTVKASINDPSITLPEIFGASTPYWIMLLVLAALIAVFPKIATWLPATMM
jgi:tripartite ATP-independent transporter DctM subunit